jgi:hypothetical protein
MRVVRTGITRTVLLVGRWAVKVPSSRRYGKGLRGLLYGWSRGVQANISEAEMCVWDEVRRDVAPVLFSLAGLINVYPRCAPVPAGRVSEARPLPFCGDRKPENLGVLDGQVVWVDYDGSWNGCPHTPVAHVTGPEPPVPSPPAPRLVAPATRRGTPGGTPRISR